MGLISDVFSKLQNQAKADLLVPVNTALDSLITTPTSQNAAGQGAQLLASLIPLLPVLEGQGIRDLATAIKTSINPTAATASTATTTATASA